MKLLSKVENLKLDKNKRYLLACSGGPDSMSLFHMLIEQGYNFAVAHVNYKTRTNSDSETEMLSKECQKYKISMFNLENNEGFAGNFESEARKFRYDFFRKLINEYQFDYLLVAHNADDLIETYLIQKNRDNLPLTYGLKEKTQFKDFLVLRPLLCYEKRTLTNYCDINNFWYSIDYTNDDVKYLRNDIRKNIISKLSIIDKQNYLDDIETKNNELETLYNDFEQNIDFNIASIEKYKNIEVLQRFLFYFASKNGLIFDNEEFKNVMNLININKDSIYKIKDHTLFINRNNIVISNIDLKDNFLNYSFNKKEFEDLGFKANISDDLLIVPLGKFKEFKMADGTNKKVNRFFIDCKMPKSVRYIWPCVVNKKMEILYVPRYRKEYKITQKSTLIFDISKMLHFLRETKSLNF